MKRFVLFFLIVCALASYSQNASVDLNQKLMRASFDSIPPAAKRGVAIFKKKSSWFNPLAYLGAGFLFVYQNVFSEQIQADCAYEVSCSERTKFAVSRRGIFIGTLEGFNQLSECAPNAQYEHPPLYVNKDGKICHQVEEARK